MKREALKYFLFFLIVFLFCVSVGFVNAQENPISITPKIVDYKGKQRDIIKGFVTLKNNTNHKINGYFFVNNISVFDGQQNFLDPSKADFSSSLANWLQITRGVVDLSPGEEREVPYSIEINLNAKPGIYHALVAVSEAPTRDQAEKKVGQSSQSVAFNLEVTEEIKEKMQLKKFSVAKNFFVGGPVSFFSEIENIGNKLQTPSGEIRIYNRRGREVGSVVFNKESATIEPSQQRNFSGTWDNAGGFGKYKAIFDVEYGEAGKASLYDTAYFWFVPWQILGLIAGGWMVVVVFIFFIAFRRSRHHSEHHAYALAGMLEHHESSPDTVSAASSANETNDKYEYTVTPMNRIGEENYLNDSVDLRQR